MQVEITNMPRFSIKKVYEKIIETREPVNWDKYIGNRLTIPKHRIIAWMAMKERLWIKSRQKQASIVQEDDCQFCVAGVETHDHLFFMCSYSQECLQAILRWIGYRTTLNIFQRMMIFLRRSRRNKFQISVIAVVLIGLMYQIWWARNEAC